MALGKRQQLNRRDNPWKADASITPNSYPAG
jgi:hypothetical protein